MIDSKGWQGMCRSGGQDRIVGRMMLLSVNVGKP